MIVTEQEILSDWKIKKAEGFAVLPIVPADYRKSRALIWQAVWELEERKAHIYDPEALEQIEKRIALLRNIIKDLTIALNA